MAQVPDYGDDMPLINPNKDEHSEASGGLNLPLTGGVCIHCGGIYGHGLTRKGKPCPRNN
jgi:hypothetical protein